MSYQYTPRKTQTAENLRSSPLRNSSTASNNSSSYSVSSNPFAPSRTSTISSTASSGYQSSGAGHKRGISETATMGPSAIDGASGHDGHAAGAYKSARQSLRPLPQAPSASPPSTLRKTQLTHSRVQSYDEGPKYHFDKPAYSPTSLATQPTGANALGLGRADSVSRRSQQQGSTSPHGPVLSAPELQDLKKSSTSHLRHLSRFAGSDSSEDFSIASPSPSVVGMHGRRQLKRTDSTRPNGGTGTGRDSTWGERNWMDKQRQFLQAYEYLCHIGEAKEWIEDIIHTPLPPIVQLEEALRDGVTLAELVQALHPNRSLRIFRNPKLQFRHSDNIALFFRFLAEVELPELFRFELIDLYEKKNIPKVIYCIHALSWLLYRKGVVDFRIGNLVGQLEFEHHELEEMQKGLDKSGVSMPSFSGMGASFGAEPQPEPEPLPVESEEDRIARELGENEATVTELQAQLRGAIIRLGLGQTMQGLWDGEEMLVDLQSIIRGAWARQIAEYRISMQRFATNLQSIARGAIVRSRQRGREEWWKGREGDIILLQSLARARTARTKTQHLRYQTRKEDSGVRQIQSAIRGAIQRQKFDEHYSNIMKTERDVLRLQAAIRGAMQRQKIEDHYTDITNSETKVLKLQAAIRGALQRQKVDEQHSQTMHSEENTIYLQAAIRGTILREQLNDDQKQLQKATRDIVALQTWARAATARCRLARQDNELQSLNGLWRALQAASRGTLARRAFQETKKRLQSQRRSIIAFQSLARSRSLRQGFDQTRELLSDATSDVIGLQSTSRACLLRRRVGADLHALQLQTRRITLLQSYTRGCILRQRHHRLMQEIFSNEPEVISLQSLSRAMMLRTEVGTLLSELEDLEPVIAEVQAAIRGRMVRGKFAEKQKYFRENMEKVIKVQSFVRGKIQGEAYKSLTSGDNPPVGTVKGFVHLLNDSDFDFDEEVEFERLRKTVVQHVRQNELADQYITQLDIKIALLVKNKITLDEVVKHQKHLGGAAGRLLTNTEIASKDSSDLKALNKNSRRKLEHYQELFFILQTQPQYLARLFKRIREQATAEKECERIRHLMMGLFGYAQKRREEYYLVKLITRSIKEEIDHCQSVQDYLRGNFFWAKLFAAYVKSPRDRKFMRDLLSPVIKENIIENPELDLESDPMQIYLSAIENEQLRTGQRSRRSPDIPREEAIRDEETKRTFIAHLQDLRDIADQFFASLEEQLPRLPYGVRYIGQQMFNYLVARFPHEEKLHVLQIVGHWVWKAYLQPALSEPEKYGAIDRGLAPEHKRNIGQVVKVLSQVAIGRLFGAENVFLQPLNTYVGESIERLGETWGNLIEVTNAEQHFDIDEFNDLYARTKPTLYIKMADIFSIHHLIAGDVGYICPPSHDDVLREAIRELGSAKNNESELMNVSTSEICLTLNPKLHEAEDPDAEVKSLFTETKRCILYIIRVQSGATLMEIMVKPITEEDEARWDALVRDELCSTSRNQRSAYSEANPIIDIASMTYPELKRTALENILRLEQQHGRLTRHNHYQDLLNAIAVDIRTKHRRRIARQRELEAVKLTLARLNDQAGYLEGQLKTYNDYIEQAMVTLQNKKGKKRFLMPFTKQWDHERELARSGRVPKFGSFKYSAQDLANRGILVSWAGYPERTWEKLDLTISSNEVGVFSIEGSNGPISIPGASAQVPLDDLLQAQFNNTQYLEFFNGGTKGEGVKVNVNLFSHLIMRKFYKDKDS